MPTSPQDPPDGSIYQSGVDNLPYALTYLRVRQDMWEGPRPPYFNVANVDLQFRWLNYTPGRTTWVQLTTDVLTGPMSGCWICSWHEAGQHRVAHIGTAGDRQIDRQVKHTFRDHPNLLHSHLRAYNPYREWGAGKITRLLARYGLPAASDKVLSLVTANNTFYSVLFSVSAPPIVPGAGLPVFEWTCCGMIETRNPLHRPEFRRTLT